MHLHALPAPAAQRASAAPAGCATTRCHHPHHPQVGYYRSAAAFFTFSLIMFIISLAMSAQFRLMAILTPDAATANPISSFLILAMVITSGFTITKGKLLGAGSGWLAGLAGWLAGMRVCAVQRKPAGRHVACQVGTGWGGPAH